jgi:dihydropyrimidinase
VSRQLLLRNARLVYADGSIVEGGLVADGGVITSVFAGDPPAVADGTTVVDAHGRAVLPGLIDPHVQLYPAPDHGHYATETRSAALGGVTTIIKMHRDLDGYDAAAFAAEIRGAESRAHVDFCFHLALMSEQQVNRTAEFAQDFGVTSFKLFTAYKGEEGRSIGVMGVDDGVLLEAFTRIAAAGGIALVHCENEEITAHARARVEADGGDDLRAFDASRPAIAEAEAVTRAAMLAGAVGCPLYIVHVTSRLALEAALRHRRDGHVLHVETEPHYLTETVDTPAGLLAKVMPPIRSADDAEALWEGVLSGEVDSIGSDHVAAQRARKVPPVWKAQLGFAGIATILPVLLSEGVAARGLPLSRVVSMTSTAPARIFGLERKGELVPGKDADFVVVDLDLERVVDAAALGSSSDFSIYEGRRLRGWPVVTVSRGEVVMRDGAVVGPEGHGRFLRRSASREVQAVA